MSRASLFSLAGFQLTFNGRFWVTTEAHENGLNRRADPSGARCWVQRLVIRSKPRTLGRGSCSLVSLAEPRRMASTTTRLCCNFGRRGTQFRHVADDAGNAYIEPVRNYVFVSHTDSPEGKGARMAKEKQEARFSAELLDEFVARARSWDGLAL